MVPEESFGEGLDACEEFHAMQKPPLSAAQANDPKVCAQDKDICDRQAQGFHLLNFSIRQSMLATRRRSHTGQGWTREGPKKKGARACFQKTVAALVLVDVAYVRSHANTLCSPFWDSCGCLCASQSIKVRNIDVQMMLLTTCVNQCSLVPAEKQC